MYRLATSSLPGLALRSDNERTMTNNYCELDLELGVPEVCACKQRMQEKAERYQRALSMYHRYTWVFSDHQELCALVKDLEGYITDLENHEGLFSR
jgi:hypothetical protein